MIGNAIFSLSESNEVRRGGIYPHFLAQSSQELERRGDCPAGWCYAAHRTSR